MTCLGVLERGERGDDNETSLKEGGGIEMSIYSASIHSNDNYNSIIVHTINISNLKKKNFLRIITILV